MNIKYCYHLISCTDLLMDIKSWILNIAIIIKPSYYLINYCLAVFEHDKIEILFYLFKMKLLYEIKVQTKFNWILFICILDMSYI